MAGDLTPTDIVDTPLFVRMTPVAELPVRLASAALVGLRAATYVSSPGTGMFRRVPSGRTNRRMTKQLLLLAMLLGMLLLPGCGEADVPAGVSGSVAPNARTATDSEGERVFVAGGSYTLVSPPKLEAILNNEDPTVVNTHIPFEGNIPDTDLSIPYDEIDRNLALLPTDKEAKIVLYCKSGRMSADAAGTLVGLGYANVWDLEGGMVAWQDAGLPLEGIRS
jgi:phage shock protein E